MRMRLLESAVFLLLGSAAGVWAQDADDVFGFDAIAIDAPDAEATADKEDADAEAVPAKVKKPKEANVNRVAGQAAVRAIFKVFQPQIAIQPAIAVGGGEVQVDVASLSSNDELDKLEKKLKRAGQQHLQQFGPAFEEYARAELRFIHEICHLKKSEFTVLQREANFTSRKALLKTVQIQVQMQDGWRGGQPPQYPDVQTMMEESLLRTAEQELSDAQFEGYQDELEARKDFRREAGAETIIANLDTDLLMSADQRGRLVEPLKRSWEGRLATQS